MYPRIDICGYPQFFADTDRIRIPKSDIRAPLASSRRVHSGSDVTAARKVQVVVMLTVGAAFTVQGSNPQSLKISLTNLTSPNVISTDLILFELSGCEADQSAVVATNQNRLIIGCRPVFATSQRSTLDSLSAFTWAARHTAF